MNPRIKLILTGIVAFAAGTLLVFYFTKASPKSAGGGDEGATASPVQLKRGVNGETVVVLDAETQKRIGLVVANLAAMEFQPETKVYGRVVDTVAFKDALRELYAAETTLDTSQQELDRAKLLKKDNNISARAFQDTEAAYEQNLLSLGSIYHKFESNWGTRIARMTGPVASGETRKRDEFLDKIPDSVALIRVYLPADKSLENLGQSARIVSLTEKLPVTATCFDKLPAVDSQTQMQGLLLVADQSPTNQLTPGEAVTAFIKGPIFIRDGISNASPSQGIIIPSDAVVRHEGKGWIYVQTGDGQFTRREISLEHLMENGWFVSGELTNRVVVTGAQTILSAELSSGGFNTGERD